MSRKLLWHDGGERQSPLCALAQALPALSACIADAKRQAAETMNFAPIDPLLTADLPGALLPIFEAAGGIGEQLQAELSIFQATLSAARRNGPDDSRSATSFVPIVAELRGMALAVAAILQEFGATLEADATARDAATAALVTRCARTTWHDPEVISCELARNDADA